MKTYDSISYNWIQNLMFMNNPNYRSSVCNTDMYGLRFNTKDNAKLCNSIFDQVSDKDRALMIGSSTTFGVGSTNDKKTIPSILSENSSYFFYNLGGRAFNGFQEIILYQLFANKIKQNVKKIVLLSGMNDVYMFSNKNFIHQFPGPFYYNKTFLNKMNDTNLSFKRKILKFLFPNLNVDYRNVQFKELINNFFTKDKKEKLLNPDTTLEEVINRNIFIWSLLSKSLNAEIIFFLPPFIDWCKNKAEYSSEEKDIEKFISRRTNFEDFENFNKIFDQKIIIKSLFKKYCEKYEIKFFDCNDIIEEKMNNNKWLFIGKTHLTDYGNNLIGEYIKTKL